MTQFALCRLSSMVNADIFSVISKVRFKMAASKKRLEFEVKKEFFEAISSGFTCSICKIVPRKGPLFISRSGDGSMACADCEAASKFPDSVSIPGTEALLANLPVTSCRYKKHDCKIIQDQDLISYHEEDCPYRSIKCIFENCKKKYPALKLSNHLKLVHQFDVNHTSTTIMLGQDGPKFQVPIPMKPMHFKRPSPGCDKIRWTPVGPLELNNRNFFVQVENRFICKQTIIWVQLYGSKLEAKNFKYSMQLPENQEAGFTTYKGPVKSLDDDKSEVFKSRNGLVLPFSTVKKHLDEGTLILHVEIEDLKVKDDDMDYDEPAFSNDEEEEEKIEENVPNQDGEKNQQNHQTEEEAM